MVSNDVLKKEFDIFGDIWKFYKMFYNNVVDWDSALATARQLSSKYDNSRFCNDLLVATIYQLERSEKSHKQV